METDPTPKKKEKKNKQGFATIQWEIIYIAHSVLS